MCGRCRGSKGLYALFWLNGINKLVWFDCRTCSGTGRSNG